MHVVTMLISCYTRGAKIPVKRKFGPWLTRLATCMSVCFYSASALLAMQTAVIARAILSVRPSVTFRCFVHRNEDTTVLFSASGCWHPTGCWMWSSKPSFCQWQDKPRTHNTFGDRSFSVAGPRVWNSLPADLRLEMQFGAFKRQLKTVLFGR